MPQNEQWSERANKALTPNYRQQPVALVRGAGARVWDADGNEYLDFLGGVAVNALGHCHPAVVRALEEQARTLWHVSNHFYIPRQVELAEELLASAPFARRAFFCNSGTEANEALLKLARKVHVDRGQPHRYEVVATDDSFHGRTAFALSATGQPKYRHGFEPLVPGFRHVPYGDLAALDAALGPNTAAFLVEPIQGESGVIPPPPGYLAKARELCHAKGALFLLDEIQTGMGRTGKLWAHEWEDARPDAMSLAKALGAGFPIGAVLATEEVGSHLTAGSHGTTFGGNPLACAVALAALREIRAILEASRKVADRLRRALEELRAGGRVVEVRGRGMLFGLRLAVDAGEVLKGSRERGLLVNAIGADTIRLAPPLTLTDDEAAEAVRRFSGALDAAPAHPASAATARKA
jgi:acetylornithine/N-succinyldiaminopimelate aminotransferase